MDDMTGGYEIAVKLFKGNLDKQNADMLKTFEKHEILVAPGTYDKVESVLSLMGIPYTVAKDDCSALETSKMVLVNCPGSWMEGKDEKIENWVKRGGHLITTDWALEHLQRIFPNHIRWNGKMTGDECVQLDKFNLQLKTTTGNTGNRPAPVWWLEGSSYPFMIGKETQVIAHSSELRSRYGNGTVAAYWRYGLGRVAHMISHYYLQRTELRSDMDKTPFKQSSGAYGFKKEMLENCKVGDLASKVPSGNAFSAVTSIEILGDAILSCSNEHGSDQKQSNPKGSRQKSESDGGQNSAKINSTY